MASPASRAPQLGVDYSSRAEGGIIGAYGRAKERKRATIEREAVEAAAAKERRKRRLERERERARQVWARLGDASAVRGVAGPRAAAVPRGTACRVRVDRRLPSAAGWGDAASRRHPLTNMLHFSLLRWPHDAAQSGPGPVPLAAATGFEGGGELLEASAVCALLADLNGGTAPSVDEVSSDLWLWASAECLFGTWCRWLDGWLDGEREVRWLLCFNL